LNTAIHIILSEKGGAGAILNARIEEPPGGLDGEAGMRAQGRDLRAIYLEKWMSFA
jgi:hypothetical protein